VNFLFSVLNICNVPVTFRNVSTHKVRVPIPGAANSIERETDFEV
jgi:hypothetical protein